MLRACSHVSWLSKSSRMFVGRTKRYFCDLNRFHASESFEDYPDGVTVVRDVPTAKRVVRELMDLTDNIHACDTETAMINDKQGIIGKDIPVICASIYVGSEYDFGSGPMIWIGMFVLLKNFLLFLIFCLNQIIWVLQREY